MLIQKLPGYLVSVLFNGVPMTIENLMFLSNKPRGTFTIQLRKSPKQSLPFNLSPAYHVSRKKNPQELPFKDEVYSYEIEIETSVRTGEAYTNDAIRFLAYDSAGNVCEYEVGIFSQRGKHYFHMARNWQSKLCWGNDGNPALSGICWPEMVGYLTNRIGIEPQGNLPSQNKSASNEINPPLKSHERIVAWFKISNGTGAIITPKGLAKMHYSDVIMADKRQPVYLKPGQRVEAFIVPADKAGMKTDFDFIAKNIRVIS